MPLAQKILHLLKDGQRPRVLNAQLLSDGRHKQFGVANGGERDKADPIYEVLAHLYRDLQAQACLANSSRSQESDQPGRWRLQKSAYGCHIPLSTYQRGQDGCHLPDWLKPNPCWCCLRILC